MKIELIGGKTVSLEAFHMTPTYAGVIVGNPTKESNDILLKHISYPKEWGQKATLLKKSDIHDSKDVLKPIIYSAWLSAEPVNDEDNQFDGSTLILIWLGDEHKEMKLEDLIVYGIGLFDWDKNSENYNL